MASDPSATDERAPLLAKPAHPKSVAADDTSSVSPREKSQGNQEPAKVGSEFFSTFITNVLPKVFVSQTSTMLGTAKKLLQEFSLLRPETKVFDLAKGQFYPLYHDHTDPTDATSLWRDRWGKTQPWPPLFLE